MTIDLRENERLDDLMRNGYKLIQNTKMFCFGMDAVLLSSFATVKEGENVIDLCTGNGVIPILLKGKTKGKHFTGLEIQEMNVDLARRSVSLNNLNEDIDIVLGDLKDAVATFGKAKFDVVTCNPPYMNENHGLVNPESCKAIARHEILCTLADVISQSAMLLKSGGRMYMVHRPHRMDEIFALVKQNGMEVKRLRLVYPFIDKEPNMVLVEAIKGAKPMVKPEKPLIIYNVAGEYTEEIKELYQ